MGDVNLYNNFFTILLFILIISSFYHPQAYILEVLVTPALGVTGFFLCLFFIHNILSLKIHNAKLQIKFRINIHLSIFIILFIYFL